MVKPERQARFRKVFLTSLALSSVTSVPSSRGLTVAVFGGSGFVGRRVCRDLIQSGCDVVSVSRSGKPPPYYLKNVDQNGVVAASSWSDDVRWIEYKVDGDVGDNDDLLEQLPPIDVAVSLVGNVQPMSDWYQLFGLGFDDERLLYENGVINERICEVAKTAGSERFVFVSVSYEVAKCLEGPIEGYMDGKRMAEHAACKLFGSEQVIVLGPSLIYGGKRFPKLGQYYRSFVESRPAKAYVAGNDFLRNLSVAPLEDWVEKMVFSPPIKVDVVSKVICAGVLGLITRDMVGDRRQGFYGTDGKPVTFDNVLYVDGTYEIERIDKLVNLPVARKDATEQLRRPSDDSVTSQLENEEPRFEGALIGKGPFLFPLRVISVFLVLFWSVATQQFVQVVNN